MLKKESLREAYGKELLKLAKKDNRVVALDADLSGSTMSCYLGEEFPDRFFEMGIAEQNMVSTAAGLSLVGKIPFVNSFAVFATGRPYDQIRQGVCLPKLNVKIVGSSSGLSDFGDGGTHQSIEDIAIMRAIPNMVVISPADAVETRKALRVIKDYEGPVYLRINRNDLPILTKENTQFQIGKIYQMQEGTDVTVFANGVMVSVALQAAEELAKEDISLSVYNVPTLKPLDEAQVIDAVKGKKGVVTAEEHNIIGGLGSAICEKLSMTGIPIDRVGVNDCFGQSASNYEELLEYYGLTKSRIMSSVKKVLG